MKIKELINWLESVAPPAYQESYDNSGLIVGNPEAEIKGVLTSLDATEAIVKEAIERGCNVIVAHHPIVFKGLKQLIGQNYVERTIIAAIKNDVAIYAIHTNLDNVFHQGVNGKIAEKIGLKNTAILAPKRELKKLSATLPAELAVQSQEAVRALGMAVQADLFAGQKLEVVFNGPAQAAILNALRNTLGQAPVYDVVALENKSMEVGSGLIGTLAEAMPEPEFLQHLKTVMQAGCVRHTRLLGRKVQRVAVCGGAGSFLLGQAIAQQADVFVTGDYKYHEFFDADGRTVIADIGHFESEQYTIDLIYEIISGKFSTFALHCAKTNTNPVLYL
ncbi:MAG: Nif3-like dinuclear metal center hexameric protein [Saprospiraceae bacterium]